MAETTFSKKVEILADLWITYSNDPEFEDFFEYNDLGLPLAYALDNDIVVANENTNKFIEETFALFLGGLEQEDTGYESLNDLLGLPAEE
jgi:hypothetical protein